MQRVFFRRGKRVEVESIEGVEAVKVGRTPEGARAVRPEAIGVALPRSTGKRRDLNLSSEEAAAFERADWVFVEPPPDRALRGSSRSAPEGTQAVGSVVRDADGRVAIVNDELIVKLSPELTEEESRALLAERSVQIVRKFGFSPNLYEARAVDGLDAIDKSVELHADERVLSAEPNLVKHLSGRSSPTDPSYSQQWQWSNSGAHGGLAGADVRAEQAWLVTRGGGVRVAVIDNGFEAGHEDLKANVDRLSAHFDKSGALVVGTANMPDHPHGTFCAAQVAAAAENGVGGCGVAPAASLVLISVLDDQVGTQATLARGVAYAADPSTEKVEGQGVDVLACSLGPNGADWELTTVLADALDFAATRGRNGRGLPIFWATTNGNFQIMRDEVVSHPAVFRVGRSTRNDTENNSGYGPELDFLAPGVDVYNATSGGYRFWTGTSFAAPLAAGVAALVLSVAPDLTPPDIRVLMQATCDKVGGLPYPDGRNDDYGHGRVNAGQAVSSAQRMVAGSKVAGAPALATLTA